MSTATRQIIETFMDSLERRDWPGLESVLSDDVVYEIPQSRERIRGRAAYLQFNREFPGDWHLRPLQIIADGRDGVIRFAWQLEDETSEAFVFFTVADGQITTITDFWPEPYEPPPGREHLVERW